MSQIEVTLRDRLPEMIRTQRRELGMSQSDLARESGIKVRMLSKYETGVVMPALWTFKPLCDALCWCADDILEGFREDG